MGQCKLYLALQEKEYPEDIHKILFILSYMKEGTAAPWVTQKVNNFLDPTFDRPSLVEFVQELEVMFTDPNWEASAHQKLSQVRQGSNSVDTVIQQFELHGPSSKLGDAGLINKFK